MYDLEVAPPTCVTRAMNIVCYNLFTLNMHTVASVDELIIV